MSVERWNKAGLCAGLLAACGSCIEAPEDEARKDDVVVGVLLPFAGDQAASGPGLEHSLLLVQETVNAAGGLDGRRMRLEVRDGHTDEMRAARAARELIDEGAVAVIGPASATTAHAIAPVLKAAGVLGVTGSWAVDALDASGELVRTAPTSLALASVLAQRARDDKVDRLAVVHVKDGYGTPFAEALADQFTKRDGSQVAVVPVGVNQTSFEGVVREVVDIDAQAVVLVTYLRQAAEIALVLPRTQLYLTSSLKNKLLLRNVPDKVFEGAVGVSPAVPKTDFEVFSRKFQERWNEEPLAEAAFFYDAAALVALAVERALVTGTSTKADSLRKSLIDISRSLEGSSATWFQLDEALDRVADNHVNYQGASGAVDLNDQGQVGRGLVELWEIKAGAIQEIGVKAASPK